MDLNAVYINRLNETRAGLESLIPRVNANKMIYPNWTLKELLDHITGWDEMVLDTLNAHLEGRMPANPAEKGIDAYNVLSIQKRSGLTLADSYTEYTVIRQHLTGIIRLASAAKLAELIVVPWGGKATVSEFLEIFAHHEEEHTADLLLWLANPDHPLLEPKR